MSLKFREKFESIKYQEWSAQSFKELIDTFKLLEENKGNKVITAEDKEKLQKTRKFIEKMINPASRFNTDYDSTFVTSMKTGSWTLFDGIETATAQLSEKISTLGGENPELDLYETGKENYFFTRKKEVENSTLIHEDFLVFISYNISSQNDKNLDHSLLSKCLCFCMTPSDSKEIDSAQIIYGSLVKNKLNSKICQTAATRFSYVHKFAKEKAKNEE